MVPRNIYLAKPVFLVASPVRGHVVYLGRKIFLRVKYEACCEYRPINARQRRYQPLLAAVHWFAVSRVYQERLINQINRYFKNTRAPTMFDIILQNRCPSCIPGTWLRRNSHIYIS